MRMGTPSSERNCFGCGPAIRVPRPAAGRIANTCIPGEVYMPHAKPSAGSTRQVRAHLREQHFVAAAEAERLVQRRAFRGGVQRNHANVAAAGFGDALLEQSSRQAPASVIRFYEDVTQGCPDL